MNHKLWLWVLAAGLLAGFLKDEVSAQFPGGPESSDPSSENKPAPPKPRIRWPKAPKLPEQYRSKDTDKDGQIGMYEWPRSDYRTFRKLDLNHDGFLTADELIRGPSKGSAPPVVASAAASPPAPAATNSAPSSAAPSETPNPDSAPPAAAAPAPAAAPAGSDAERQWDVLDKDKDGKVTEEEWGRSYFARPKFRDAGVAVTFPLARDEFIRLYQQVVPKK
jgi:hypothetical protein